jgi:hypothetical protein
VQQLAGDTCKLVQAVENRTAGNAQDLRDLDLGHAIEVVHDGHLGPALPTALEHRLEELAIGEPGFRRPGVRRARRQGGHRPGMDVLLAQEVQAYVGGASCVASRAAAGDCMKRRQCA